MYVRSLRLSPVTLVVRVWRTCRTTAEGREGTSREALTAAGNGQRFRCSLNKFQREKVKKCGA